MSRDPAHHRGGLLNFPPGSPVGHTFDPVPLPAGCRRTTGGTWDPTSDNINFIAGGLQPLEQADNPYSLIAVNEVKTPKEREHLLRLAEDRLILLDSGIFNLAMTHARKNDVSHNDALNLPPEEIDGFDRLFDKYLDLASSLGDRLWGVIELDQGGVEHKPRTRERIIKESGIIPIPVYHPFGDGWDYYDTIAAGYDRICFGNLVKASAPVRLRLMWTACERSQAYPHLWTHLLGVTPSGAMLSMPMRGSCDSSSWSTAIRWSANWKGWTMLQRVNDATMRLGMVYEYGTEDTARGAGGNASLRKANQLILGQARFQQHTLAALREDTHPFRDWTAGVTPPC